jgi:hypothetical protein
MHPEIAKTLVAQHRDELVQHAPSRMPRSERRSWLPRWHISWTRTTLAPAAANRARRAGQRDSSLVIIISAHRSA